MWLHYTAALVMVPLGIWLVSQRAITPRRRGWCAVGLASGALIELPLFLTQYHYTPNGGLGNLGAISWVNTFKVVGTPFDGRFNEGLNAYRVVGALLVGGALGVVVARDRRNVGTRALLLALGATPLVVILLLGVAGKDIVISRYTAVAAPFLLTTMAAAVSSVRRPAAAILGAALLGVSVWGLVNSHRVSGFYAPARQTMALIAHHERPGDIVEVPGDAGDDIPLAYYGQRLLHPALPYVPEGQHATILAAVHQHRRFWLIGHLETPPTSHTVLARAIAELANAIRYRPLLLSEYRGGVTYIVALIGARR
jgi:hypothetical protein